LITWSQAIEFYVISKVLHYSLLAADTLIIFHFLDPINPVFYSNSAAVYLDLKKYPKAREMCLKAIDLSMEYGVDDKIFGKILARLGNLDQQEGNYSSGL